MGCLTASPHGRSCTRSSVCEDPRAVDCLRTVVRIAVQARRQLTVTGCFLAQDDASVKCWGYNWWGQLGLGDRVDRGDDPNGQCAALNRCLLGPLFAVCRAGLIFGGG
jgi:hypothetical protein